MLLNASSPSPLADAIRREVYDRRRNYFIVIHGKTQMRKSTLALSLAYSVDRDFDLDRQLAIMKTKNFLEALHLDNLKRCSCIVLDEFGVGQYHRQWYTFLNQAINYVMQTHGHKGLVVIATVPVLTFIDSDTRKLIDLLIEVLEKNEEEKYAVVKVEELQYNQKLDKTYFKYPRCFDPRQPGPEKVVETLEIDYPPDEILERYYAIANEAKTMLEGELIASAGKVEAEKLRRGMFNPEVYVAEILRNPEPFMVDRYGYRYISRELIMNHWLGLGDTRARQIKALAEKRLRELEETKVGLEAAATAGQNTVER
jgi:hypothetical protein